MTDFIGRFEPGNWMYTSPVEKVEGNLIHTMNSLYQAEGEMEVISLPIGILPTLYEDVPPQSVRAMIESGYSFISPFTGEPIVLNDLDG